MGDETNSGSRADILKNLRAQRGDASEEKHLEQQLQLCSKNPRQLTLQSFAPFTAKNDTSRPQNKLQNEPRDQEQTSPHTPVESFREIIIISATIVIYVKMIKADKDGYLYVEENLFLTRLVYVEPRR